ncbi:MAG: DUF1643 domain-containing protein, partial [Rhodobacteraceae bacterium]|nr:DUF1643 domain-containing protein [Paracoccaceae bacterium]
FAYRATDPRDMRAAPDPVGPDNDAAIIDSAVNWIKSDQDQIICAWGTHGAFMDRGTVVESELRQIGKPLATLGLSKAGHPKHPLYIGYDQQPMAWVADQSGH